MNWSALFGKTLSVALASLPIAALICGLIVTIGELSRVGLKPDDLDMAALLVFGYFVYFLLYGVPCIFVYGAPVYALLRKLGWANWGSALVVGIVPGLGLLAWQERETAVLAMVAGLIVAASTHFFVSRFARGQEAGVVA